MDQAKPKVRSGPLGLWPPAEAACTSQHALGRAVLAQLEDCLATLDELHWTLPAAHLSLAVDSVRHQLTLTQIEDSDRADMLPR